MFTVLQHARGILMTGEEGCEATGSHALIISTSIGRIFGTDYSILTLFITFNFNSQQELKEYVGLKRKTLINNNINNYL